MDAIGTLKIGCFAAKRTAKQVDQFFPDLGLTMTVLSWSKPPWELDVTLNHFEHRKLQAQHTNTPSPPAFCTRHGL